MDNKHYMEIAIKEAIQALEIDEVPIGAIIVKDDQIIARAHNLKEINQKSTAHAELLAIEKACEAIGSWRLEECTLYVTLEPCPMCAGAIIQSRIKHVVFGAYDPKGGSICSVMKMFDTAGYNHYPTYEGGVLNEMCSKLLTDFFKNKRKQKNKQF